MKKRVLTICFFLVLLVCLLTGTALAADFQDADTGLYFDVLPETDKTVEVVRPPSGDYSMLEVAIPRTVTHGGVTYAVTQIGNASFRGSNLRKVTLPDTITSIAAYAFHNATYLHTINFPEGLTRIGAWAFEGCGSLSSIQLPETLTDLNEGVFKGTGLTSVRLPDGITSIPSGLFEDCVNLIEVIFPSGVTDIWDYAFKNTGFTTITLPATVTYIHFTVFEECQNLTEVILQENVVYVGQHAFAYCPKLTRVTVLCDGSTDLYVSESAFKDSPNVKVVYQYTAPTYASLSATGKANADAYCYWQRYSSDKASYRATLYKVSSTGSDQQLSQVAMPYSPTGSSYKHTFEGKLSGNGVYYVAIQTVAPEGDETPYEASEAFTTNYIGVGCTCGETHTSCSSAAPNASCPVCSVAGEQVSVLCQGNTTISVAIDPVRVNEAGGSVTINAASLEGWYIYSRWTTDRSQTFTAEEIYNYYASIGMAGVYPKSVGTTEISMYYDNVVGGVVTRDPYYGYIVMSNGTEYSNVLKVSMPAYGEKCVLRYYPNGGNGQAQSTRVYAFICAEADSLGYVAPEGKVFAGWNTASNGSGDAYVPGHLYDLSGELTLYAQWIDLYEFTELSDGTLEIHKYNGKEAAPAIPEEHNGKTVTTIGEEAFAGNQYITSITLPDTITRLEKHAFQNCGSVTSVTLNNGLTYIGEGALQGLAVESLIIPNTVTELGTWAFAENRLLTSLTLGTGLTTLPYAAIYRCNSLPSITLPVGITSIGQSAFGSCYYLRAVTYQGTVAQLAAVTISDERAANENGNDNLRNAEITFSDGSVGGFWGALVYGVSDSAVTVAGAPAGQTVHVGGYSAQGKLLDFQPATSGSVPVATGTTMVRLFLLDEQYQPCQTTKTLELN